MKLTVDQAAKSSQVWSVDERGYWDLESEEARLRFLARYAILAPSGHNTQPWLFRIRNGVLALRADRTRALPVVDPDDRELTISCGAALFNLRAAARGLGRYWRWSSFRRPTIRISWHGCRGVRSPPPASLTE